MSFAWSRVLSISPHMLPHADLWSEWTNRRKHIAHILSFETIETKRIHTQTNVFSQWIAHHRHASHPVKRWMQQTLCICCGDQNRGLVWKWFNETLNYICNLSVSPNASHMCECGFGVSVRCVHIMIGNRASDFTAAESNAICHKRHLWVCANASQ